MAPPKAVTLVVFIIPPALPSLLLVLLVQTYSIQLQAGQEAQVFMPSMCLRPLLPFQLKQSRLIFTQWKQYKLLIAWWTMDIILFTSYFWKHLSFFSVPKKGLQLDNLTHHYRGSGLGNWLIKINWRTASSISNQSPKPNCCFHTAAGTWLWSRRWPSRDCSSGAAEQGCPWDAGTVRHPATGPAEVRPRT